MNRCLHWFNLAGVLALALLCVVQWRLNRQLNLELNAAEKARQQQAARLGHTLYICYVDLATFFPSIERGVLLEHELLAGVPRDVLNLAAAIFGAAALGYPEADALVALGVALFIAEADDKGLLWVFWVKLASIALALIVTSRIKGLVFGSGRASDDVSGAAKSLAVVSIGLWLLAITAGRLMAYLK